MTHSIQNELIAPNQYILLDWRTNTTSFTYSGLCVQLLTPCSHVEKNILCGERANIQLWEVKLPDGIIATVKLIIWIDTK